MNNVEFVLSLNPEQVNKFIELNLQPELMISLIWTPERDLIWLHLRDKNYRMRYSWINNNWIENE